MDLREGTRRLSLLTGGVGFVLCGIVSLFAFQGELQGKIHAPSAWSYVLQVIFPLVGFAVPWGIIRGIGCVLAGFLQPWPKQDHNSQQECGTVGIPSIQR